MAGHAQLKFVMTECSKTQIRLTGLNLHNIKMKTLIAAFLVLASIRRGDYGMKLKECPTRQYNSIAQSVQCIIAQKVIATEDNGEPTSLSKRGNHDWASTKPSQYVCTK